MDEQAKKIMEEGWKARENLDFEKAEKLLKEAKDLFEKDEDWFNVTEALNHLAYLEKLQAVQHNIKGIKLTEDSEELSNKYSTKKGSVLRAKMSLAGSAGVFEQALKYSLDCLAETTKPLPRADVLSHVATFQLRTGNLAEAEKTINEAEQLFNKHREEGNEPHRSIWESKILAAKGLVLYNKGEVENAKEYFKKALEMAEKQNLKTRIGEISELMKLI